MATDGNLSTAAIGPATRSGANLIRAASIAAVLTAGLAGPAAAATVTPPGSYESTCTNVAVQPLLGGSGENLTARCQKHDGQYVDAWLSLPCAGDIQNHNGRLTCVPGPNPFAPPPGSYQAKCRDVSMAGPILRGTCRSARHGKSVATAINTLDCRGADIKVNAAGELAC